MIEELLVPTDEARNEHKRLQLQELAALNGAHQPRQCFSQRCFAMHPTADVTFACQRRDTYTYCYVCCILSCMHPRFFFRILRSNVGTYYEG